jgi:hypothetical protein
MCDVKELSERSRELDTNVLYLAPRRPLPALDPDDDAGVQRRLLQVDTLAQTHRLEKFLQGQFGPDSRLSRLEKAYKRRLEAAPQDHALHRRLNAQPVFRAWQKWHARPRQVNRGRYDVESVQEIRRIAHLPS